MTWFLITQELMYGYVVILSNPIDSLAMNEITYVYITLLGLLYSQGTLSIMNVSYTQL